MSMRPVAPQQPKRKQLGWGRALVLIIAVLLIVASATLATLHILSLIASTVLVVLPILFAIGTWLYPFTPIADTSSDTPLPPQPLQLAVTVQAPPTSQLPPSQPSGQQAVQKTIWNVPHPRNPLFTGREEILKHLHNNLLAHETTARTQLQAVSGLGGIGKTQTAVEYAYRYRKEYTAIVWIQADTEEILHSDIAALAQEPLLNLPQKDEKEQNRVINAVINWLNTHTDWLLILDNVNDIPMLQTALFQRAPIALRYGKGCILLTTRSQATGPYINGIELPRLDAEQGADFLIRRVHKRPYASETDRSTAKTISVAMDGLPLALDQAGAYMEETQCSFSHYYEQYRNQKERAALLKRRGNLASDHPESVTATFALSFDKVQRINALATEILYTCAFLYPENIPEDILIRGVPELSAKLQAGADKSHEFDEALAILNSYSLIRRDIENRTLTIHLLTQAVVQATMDENEQRQWAERVIRAVNHTFPEGDYTTWTRCQRYLPHALASEVLIRQWNIQIPEAAFLLNQTGLYLQMHVQYSEAEPLLQQALSMREQVLGPEHPDTATSLQDLGVLYVNQGKYAEAEPVLKHSLGIRERMLGPEHFILTNSLHLLAELYMRQGKYTEAEPFVQRALTIDEKVNGFNQPNVISDLNNLAGLYVRQSRYEEAEPLLQRALAIEEQVFGPQPPDTSTRKNYERLQKLIRQRDKAK